MGLYLSMGSERCIVTSVLKIVCLRVFGLLLIPLVLFSSVNRVWKIADFGMASRGSSNQLVTSRYCRGKDGYRAPELPRMPTSHYNNKADIWSLGCIAFELISGRKAFYNDYEILKYAESDVAVIP